VTARGAAERAAGARCLELQCLELHSRVYTPFRPTTDGLTRGTPGIYNIVDDDPAPVSQWLPALAEALGAKPPRRIPAWIARFIIGDAVIFLTNARGASNAKAKGAFGLNLKWPSWRDGFRRGLGDPL
jgi:2-alkyl-3-oxoalkanoate reductase